MSEDHPATSRSRAASSTALLTSRLDSRHFDWRTSAVVDVVRVRVWVDKKAQATEQSDNRVARIIQKSEAISERPIPGTS